MITNQDITRAESDLVRLVEADLGPGRRSGRWVMYTCPFHDDHVPSLGVTNGKEGHGAFWRCFGCGKSGDTIAWLKEYRQLTFTEAVGVLADGNYQVAARPAAERAPAPILPPNDTWQERARRLIDRAQEWLWGPEGSNDLLSWPKVDPISEEIKVFHASALDYLLSRGLAEQTIQLWRLGYIPRNWKDKAARWGLQGDDLLIPQGILLPCVVSERTWYLKVRRPILKPKFSQVKGSRPALYMVQALEGHTRAVLAEGELDALLLWQEAGDLAGVATLGSAGYKLDVSTWGIYLLKVERWLLAYDADEAGQDGAGRLDWLKNARRAEAPQLQPGGKDLTDYFQAGGDLRQWLAAELARE